jgi:hypothetical protein
MDQRANNLVEGWKKLARKDQETLLFQLQFLLEKQRPDSQRRRAAEEDHFRCEMQRVFSFGDDLSRIATEARALLNGFLDDRKMKDIFIDYELIRFYEFATRYKPFLLFDEGNKYVAFAKKTAKRLKGRIDRLKGKPL